ncbi:hypothetical protein BJF83_18920 [Nocardiopsis sp. CNR-923]|nr:hypothetical protein BJF83_18920 [Nocardiopsis sp. CNR-923]
MDILLTFSEVDRLPLGDGLDDGGKAVEHATFHGLFPEPPAAAIWLTAAEVLGNTAFLDEEHTPLFVGVLVLSRDRAPLRTGGLWIVPQVASAPAENIQDVVLSASHVAVEDHAAILAGGTDRQGRRVVLVRWALGLPPRTVDVFAQFGQPLDQAFVSTHMCHAPWLRCWLVAINVCYFP